MVINIMKSNFNEVMNAECTAFLNADYNDECCSTSDVRAFVAARNEHCELAERLETARVNLFMHLRPIYLDKGLGWNDNYNEEFYKDYPKEIPNDLNVVMESYGLAHFFDEKDRYLLKEGFEPPMSEANFTEYNTFAIRFKFQVWNIDEKAFSELILKPVYKNTLEAAKTYLKDKVAQLYAVETIKDDYADIDTDCSSILLKYKLENGEDLYFIGQHGGFYKDIMILSNNVISDIIPLYADGEKDACSRVGTPISNLQNASYYLSSFFELESKIRKIA